MSRVTAGVAFGILFIGCLLAMAPARLLSIVLPAKEIIIQGYSGTVWSGTANRALLSTTAGYIHLGRISWSLSPLSLLALSPSLSIESSWGRQHINTGLRITGPEDLELTDLDAMVSVQLLRKFLPLSVAGDFSIQAQELSIENGLPSRARGRLVWQNAAWESAAGPVSLGSYAVDFQQTPGGALEADIITLAGRVKASGSAQLLGKDYNLDILISSDVGLGIQLEQALSLIAQPVPEGRRIKFDGQLQDFD